MAQVAENETRQGERKCLLCQHYRLWRTEIDWRRTEGWCDVDSPKEVWVKDTDSCRRWKQWKPVHPDGRKI